MAKSIFTFGVSSIAKSRKKIIWKDDARADLRAIDRLNAMHILRGLDRLVTMGEGDVKRLKDVEPPENRLRVGDYRVRFHDLGDTLMILSVNHRSKAYR